MLSTRLPIHFGGELGQESALCGKATTPPDLTAIARYPSNLISQTHCAPSGSLATARHSIGSMNAGSRLGRERSLARLTLAIGIV